MVRWIKIAVDDQAFEKLERKKEKRDMTWEEIIKFAFDRL